MVVVESSAATATMLVFSAINGLGDAFKKRRRHRVYQAASLVLKNLN